MLTLLRKSGMHDDVLILPVPGTILRWPVCADLIKSQDGAIQTKSFIHDVNQQVETDLKPFEILEIWSTGTFPVFTTVYVFGRWLAEPKLAAISPPSPHGLRRGNLTRMRERRLVETDGIEPTT
jgi:hypothetical protein